MPTEKKPNSRTLVQCRIPQEGSTGTHEPKRPRWPTSLPQAPQSFISRHSIRPDETRESMQQYLDVRKRLFTTPSFRQSIDNLRRHYPPEYWTRVPKLQRRADQLDKELKKGVMKLLSRFWAKAGDAPVVPSLSLRAGGTLRFQHDATELCQQFGLDVQDSRWVEWLVRNWDPSTSDAPPLEHEPLDLRPNFFPWHITVTDFVTDFSGANRRRVTLVLEQGASLTASSKAAARAVQELPASYRRNAPSITDMERERLYGLFLEHGLNEKRAREADFRTLAKCMEQEYWKISQPTIRKEYYGWTKRLRLPFLPEPYNGASSRDRRS